MNTPETTWIKDLREAWLKTPPELRKKLKLAYTFSGTATCARSSAFTWMQAWGLGRLEWYGTAPRLLKTYRDFMRHSALEAVALARHYVMETERQEQAQRARDAARFAA